MYHHCRNPARKQNPYLGGGCARGSNAHHDPPFIFPLNDEKHKCDACHNMVHPPLLWVCENRRWEPDVRGVCVQCAATLMIESEDGPNIVVQNSHTVLVTSLFCVKIAHELRMVYAGVYPEDAKIMIQLEPQVEDIRPDAVVGIEGVAVVFIENQSSRHDPDRVTKCVQEERDITFENETIFETSKCNAIFGLLLQLDKFREISQGRQILDYVACGTDSHPILPYVLPSLNTRHQHIALVTTDYKTMAFKVTEIKQVMFLRPDSGNMSISYHKHTNISNRTRRLSNFLNKFEAPVLRGPVGANFLQAIPKIAGNAMCTLCGVPLKFESDPSPATLLEAVKDSMLELRVKSLTARGVGVRQNYNACLSCSAVFQEKLCIAAFHARFRDRQPRPVVAREYKGVGRGRYLKITENFGKRLDIQFVKEKDDPAVFTPYKVRDNSRNIMLNEKEFTSLIGKLGVVKQHEKQPDATARFKVIRDNLNDILALWQLILYYEEDKSTKQYTVYPLFDDINDVTKRILAHAHPKQDRNYSLAYVLIGKIPTTNLVQAQHLELECLYGATRLSAPSLRAVQMWKILGLAVYNILNLDVKIDLFLHHVWDPFMLDELERVNGAKHQFFWLELMQANGNSGQEMNEVPKLLTIFVDKNLRCGQRAFVRGKGKYICVYASCVQLWAHCTRNNNVDFDVMMRVLFLDLFFDVFRPNGPRLTQKARQLAAMHSVTSPQAMLATERALQGVRKSEQFPRGDLGLAAHAAARVVGDHARAAALEALRTHEWLRAVALG